MLLAGKSQITCTYSQYPHKAETKFSLHLILKEYFLMSPCFQHKESVQWALNNAMQDDLTCGRIPKTVKCHILNRSYTIMSFVTRTRVYMDFHIMNGLSSYRSLVDKHFISALSINSTQLGNDQYISLQNPWQNTR